MFLMGTLMSHDVALGAEVMSPGPAKAPLVYAVKLPKYCWDNTSPDGGAV